MPVFDFSRQPRFKLGVLSLALLGLFACSKQEAAKPAMPPMPVTVLEAQPTTITTGIEIAAQAEGAKETEVRARIGGIMLKRMYQEGAQVKAGQPLFMIDPAQYQIALADAQARAEQANREAARLKGLIAQQAVSQKEYDDAVTTAKLAEATLRQARLNLSYTTVTAPVSGTAGRVIKSEGSLVTVGTDSLLTTIYQSNPIWVRFGLGESDLAKLPGGKLSPATLTGAELILPDGSVYPQKGKINFVAANMDTALGTRQLRAEFTNTDGTLVPGQFVRLRLLTGKRDGVFLVPQSAVVQTEQGAVLMLAGADNKVAPRPVQTGEWQGKNWVILGGLKAGDRVIVDNLIKLRPGATVAPKGPQPAGQPQGMAGMGGMSGMGGMEGMSGMAGMNGSADSMGMSGMVSIPAKPQEKAPAKSDGQPAAASKG